MKDGLNKIDEEVQELKDADNNLNQLEEGWDIIFAVITHFHKLDFADYAIKQSMLSTLQKIERRSNKALENKN